MMYYIPKCRSLAVLMFARDMITLKYPNELGLTNFLQYEMFEVLATGRRTRLLHPVTMWLGLNFTPEGIGGEGSPAFG
jgi:hypothetical protein